MNHDLIPFEKDILKVIKFKTGKKFDHRHLMEWNSSKEAIEKNIQEGEVIYEAMGVFVAIKENM